MKRQICGGENGRIGKCKNEEKGCELRAMRFKHCN
jgi:hypothetical protein